MVCVAFRKDQFRSQQESPELNVPDPWEEDCTSAGHHILQARAVGDALKMHQIPASRAVLSRQPEGVYTALRTGLPSECREIFSNA